MRSRRGFTLIELLGVMTIIMVMAGVVLPAFTHLTDLGRPNAMAATVRQVRE